MTADDIFRVFSTNVQTFKRIPTKIEGVGKVLGCLGANLITKRLFHELTKMCSG